MVSWHEAGEPARVLGGGAGAAYAACQGPSRLGSGAGAPRGLAEGAWAGVTGQAHGAGAGPVGHGIGNDAWWGVWPGGYWWVGGAAGWGAAGRAAAHGTRLRPPAPRLGAGRREGVPWAPGTSWVAARAMAGSSDMPPWSVTAASIACRSSGRAAVAAAPTMAV